MKRPKVKKTAIGLLGTGFVLAGLGFGANLFTLFNVYHRADDADCRSEKGCNIDNATSSLPLGKFLTYLGVALIIVGALLLIFSSRWADKK